MLWGRAGTRQGRRGRAGPEVWATLTTRAKARDAQNTRNSNKNKNKPTGKGEKEGDRQQQSGREIAKVRCGTRNGPSARDDSDKWQQKRQTLFEYKMSLKRVGSICCASSSSPVLLIIASPFFSTPLQQRPSDKSDKLVNVDDTKSVMTAERATATLVPG